MLYLGFTVYECLIFNFLWEKGWLWEERYATSMTQVDGDYNWELFTRAVPQ